MSPPVPPPDPELEHALAWIRQRGISLVPWPDDEPSAVGGARDQPTLYLVRPGADPPPYHRLRDWVREPINREELLARADQLLAMARRDGPVSVAVDDDGILRVDDALVILSPLEGQAMALFVARMGMLVERRALEYALWGEPCESVGRLASVITGLRRRLRDVPLELHTIRGAGFLLERLPPAGPGERT